MKEPNDRLMDRVSAGISGAMMGLYCAVIFTGANYRSKHLKQMFGEGLAKIAESECDTYKQRKEFLEEIHQAAIFELGLMQDRT